MSNQPAKDLELCSRLVDMLIEDRDNIRKELDRRETLVLWTVVDLNNGETVDRFTTPGTWMPGEDLRNRLSDRDLSLEYIGQIRWCESEQEIIKLCTGVE